MGVVEVGSAMLCAEAGIEPDYGNSAAYCKAWLKVLMCEDPKFIINAAQRAQKAVDWVVGHKFEEGES